ncbi:peptide ABC transporter permease [Acrocarpospora pleiomorpha]|uniref:Peptide ABC transporter permease n=1 Tax=Acrocarpospora pleiomorpha TaxID=90975 RepID=A0A5M3XML5_9ACTN|nr:ABC transporter permease [Acrocarpospora pleiomorpha]GES20393.1 peptide ABC transporter permease [Acrocarpospora pleiomorpha]
MTILTGRGLAPAEPTAPPARGVLARLLKRRDARAALVILVLGALGILAGPALVPYAPDVADFDNVLSGPSAAHWLGTDQFGRDQLARLLDGGSRSLLATALVLVISVAAGLIVGTLAGVAGGLIDVVAMRAVDMALAVPGVVLTLALLGALGPGFGNLVIALAATAWPPYARLARSYVRSGRERPDVVTARLAGAGWPRAAVAHLLPGAATHVMVVAALDVGHTIMAVTGLSFLGLGAQPPDAEWGVMLSDSRLYLTQAPWLLLAPSAAIVLVILAAILLGEAAAEVSDPRRAR